MSEELEKGTGKAERAKPEKTAKIREPFIMKFANFMLLFAILVAVTAVVALCSRVFGTMSKPLLISLLAATPVCFIVWIIIIKSNGYADKSLEYEAAVKEQLKKEAESFGEVYCTKEQMKRVVEICDNSYVTHERCPVCDEKLEYGTCEYRVNVRVHEPVEGVYVSRFYGDEVKQAYQTVSKMQTFPAKKCRCPACEWEMYYAEYVSYEENSEPDKDGYKGYSNQTYHAHDFKRGKLYHKVNAPKVYREAGKFYETGNGI